MRVRNQVAAAVAASFVSAQAFAVPVTLPQTLSNGFFATQWSVSNGGGTSTGAPFTGNCDGTPGVVVVDATGPTGAGDAYDNAWNVWVNGAIVAQSAGDLTGSTLTMNPVTMSGLNVTIQYHAVPGIALLRTLVTLQNPTGGSIAAAVAVPVNFGSDSGSIIQTTSSGDAVVTTADRWVISSDSGPSDPVLLTAMYQTNATVPPSSYTTTVYNCAADPGLGATFNLNIPAGQSLSLVFFAGLSGVNANTNTVASSLAAAQALFDTPNGLAAAGGFGGLTAQQIAALANWGPVALPPPVSRDIPTLTEWALILMSLLVAGVGGLSLRNRRIGRS